MTYTEMTSNVMKVASALNKRGLKAGDSVLLMAPNFIEVPVVLFASWKAGGNCACLTLNLFAGRPTFTLLFIYPLDE